MGASPIRIMWPREEAQEESTGVILMLRRISLKFEIGE
jgi:hypothetical protein